VATIPADVSRDVRSESRYPSSRWSVNGYIALIADEMSRFGVVDHYAVELQVTVRVTLNSVRKVTCCCLRVDQFWPKVLNFEAFESYLIFVNKKRSICSH
jgi:hypothetical protein